MGKQGPCFHCGVTSTPLWRNGPPEKPVLCNACGSRWRTKGTLVNYTPLHARPETDELEDYKIPKVKSMPFKSKEAKLYKRKQYNEGLVGKREVPDYNQNFQRGTDEDTSNRSSSGSAISYSESCAQFGGTDASEFTGSAQSIVWDTLVPSKKRTCVGRPKPSSVEKLTKDLYSILHEQQSSYFSGSSEEGLLFENESPMVSVEIGHGSILMKLPHSVTREEESEASSFLVDNKTNIVNEVYSGPAPVPVHNDSKGVNYTSLGIDKIKRPLGLGNHQENTKSDKYHKEKSQYLLNRRSPLRSIDLKDVVSFEEFTRQFSHEEQQLLIKQLPSADTTRLPDSLKSMFSSAQFAENISSFQQLLAEGVFDLSFSGTNTEECKTLKKLALGNMTKSKWVEHYNIIKDVKRKQSHGGKGIATGSNVLATNKILPLKRHRDPQYQNFPESKPTMRSPKRLVIRGGYETKEPTENDGSCFSPRSLFAFPPDRSSIMLDCLQFTDDSSEHDLLFDVPSNGSFPQAELLHPSSSFGSQQASTSSSVVSHHLLHP